MRAYSAGLVLVLLLGGISYLVAVMVRFTSVEYGTQQNGKPLPYTAQKLTKKQYIAYLKRTGKWDDLEIQRRIRAVEDSKHWD